MKIQNKLTIISLVKFFVSITVFGIIVIVSISNLTKDEISNHLQTTAVSRANHIETYLNQNIERLKLITSRTKLRNTISNYNQEPNEEDRATIIDIIQDAAEPIDEFDRICIIGLDGIIIGSTDDNFCGRDIHDKDFFVEGLKKESAYFVQEDGQSKIFISGPLVLEDEVIAVGITVVNADVLNEIVSNNIGLGTSGEVLLAKKGEEGLPIFLTNRKFESNDFVPDEDSSKARPMQAALNGQETFFEKTIDYRGEEVFSYTQYLGDYELGLLAKIDRAEALAPLNYLIRFLLIILVIFTIIYIVINYFVARNISRPIEELHHGTEIIEKGNLDHKVGTNANDEIGQLSRSFDDMVESIKKSRVEVDKKVEKQTKEIAEKAKETERQQIAIMNILEDVEEEKEKTLFLAKDLEKFKLAVDNASDHIAITDENGIIIYGNKAVEKITGYAVEEVAGKKAGTKQMWGGLMDEDFYKKLWKKIKTDKKVFNGVLKNKRKNGEEYDADISISPILDENGHVKFFVAIERDISKEMQIDRAKSEFVSLASHQLRTPLSTINWYAEMLLSGDAGKLKDEQKEYLQEIYKGNQRMVDLVNSLLNVSRIELGTLAVEPKPTSMTDLSNSVIKELTPQINKKKLKVTKKYGKSIPKIELDSKLMRIVFQNLLSNAVKYTPEKGKINVAISKSKSQAKIEVSDTGMGIPKSQQDNIFTKLFRADNVREKNTDGTGLGLYIVKSVIEQFGGKVWFKSVENKGTTFYVTIPLKGVKPKEGSKGLEYTK